MKNLKNEKGVTLAALTITIIILLILASVGTYSGIEALRSANEESQISELEMLQHVVLENYSKYLITHNVERYIVGKPLSYAEVKTLVNGIDSSITLKINDYDSEEETESKIVKSYYLLENTHLQEMSVNQVESGEYIVNYKTGEVINKSVQKTKSGKPLYTYATEE